MSSWLVKIRAVFTEDCGLSGFDYHDEVRSYEAEGTMDEAMDDAMWQAERDCPGASLHYWGGSQRGSRHVPDGWDGRGGM